MKAAIGHQTLTKNPPRSHKFQGPIYQINFINIKRACNYDTKMITISIFDVLEVLTNRFGKQFKYCITHTFFPLHKDFFVELELLTIEAFLII